MPTLPVFDMSGQEVGNLELRDEVFGAPYNRGLIHQIFCGLRANARRGTHSTKTRSEVRGGGKKPWRQKGTGMSRHGSRRSPIWRGGGVTFGPKPRDYTQALPKKMRRQALKSALSQRVREAKVTALSELTLDEFRTRAIVEMLGKLKVEERRTLVVLDAANPKVQKSASNIPGLQVVLAENLNLVDVVLSHRLVATRNALQKLEEVLSR
ncbi:MAG: 50S ribosomal protein L4 [Armatimonadetes bacterium]|nr:50S ribosomal protein L4 [Armatimonadota bacterium]